MGWADDMYDAGYTSEHGGLMDDRWYRDSSSSNRKKSNHGKPWSDSARLKVAILYSKGRSVGDIAIEFRRSPYAIAWQLYNKGEITEYEREKFK